MFYICGEIDGDAFGEGTSWEAGHLLMDVTLGEIIIGLIR